MRQIYFLIAITLVGLSNGQLSTLDVHFDQPGHEISPVLWGIFFEEINHAGDGGREFLYLSVSISPLQRI
jgi:hypothetical protein